MSIANEILQWVFIALAGTPLWGAIYYRRTHGEEKP